jgi:hypothetical protein
MDSGKILSVALIPANSTLLNCPCGCSGVGTGLLHKLWNIAKISQAFCMQMLRPPEEALRRYRQTNKL